jgi:hypothetical protein
MLGAKTGWLGIRIMCQSGRKCLPAECCFSELALKKSKSVCWYLSKTDIIISSKCNLFSPWYSWQAHLTLNNNHSLTHETLILNTFLYDCIVKINKMYVYLQGKLESRLEDNVYSIQGRLSKIESAVSRDRQIINDLQGVCFNIYWIISLSWVWYIWGLVLE